ncbi:MAG TPA: hypothetical protein EYQ24_07360 [Bacteroidetes bacterium]|nr:hypothetical protein [Bacteroidota bacterium]HIL57558.1 hypothetical protein [Rhodothermales bacterium]
MSRIIHAGDTPAKRRRQLERSCAEALRTLAAKPALASGVWDAEAKDLAAFLAYSLRGIGETIEGSAQAWDDRNYWKKAEKLRADWIWTSHTADDLEEALLAADWRGATDLLVTLVPRFAHVNIGRELRDADWWAGAYRALQKRAAKAA